MAFGWDQSIGRDVASVLVARMDSTSLQIADLDMAGVGRVMAWAAAKATSDLLQALLHLRSRDHSRAVAALDAAETSAHNLLAGIQEARAVVGENGA